MQPNANPEANRTPEVEPAIKHTVAWRLASVIPAYLTDTMKPGETLWLKK
jgi:hypothetical protein